MTRRVDIGNNLFVPIYSTDRVFVVKLSAEADSAHVVGQVENVSSGESTRFEALEQLVLFMSKCLGQAESLGHEQGKPNSSTRQPT